MQIVTCFKKDKNVFKGTTRMKTRGVKFNLNIDLG